MYRKYHEGFFNKSDSTRALRRLRTIPGYRDPGDPDSDSDVEAPGDFELVNQPVKKHTRRARSLTAPRRVFQGGTAEFLAVLFLVLCLSPVLRGIQTYTMQADCETVNTL
ncbi:hypothetical protein SNK03_008786 [Fusarium graminearum]